MRRESQVDKEREKKQHNGKTFNKNQEHSLVPPITGSAESGPPGRGEGRCSFPAASGPTGRGPNASASANRAHRQANHRGFPSAAAPRTAQLLVLDEPHRTGAQLQTKRDTPPPTATAPQTARERERGIPGSSRARGQRAQGRRRDFAQRR